MSGEGDPRGSQSILWPRGQTPVKARPPNLRRGQYHAPGGPGGTSRLSPGRPGRDALVQRQRGRQPRALQRPPGPTESSKKGIGPLVPPSERVLLEMHAHMPESADGVGWRRRMDTRAWLRALAAAQQGGFTAHAQDLSPAPLRDQVQSAYCSLEGVVRRPYEVQALQSQKSQGPSKLHILDFLKASVPRSHERTRQLFPGSIPILASQKFD
ncbi:uncharacterized protein LOC129402068 [Sorex araneus]|uniref:uncharacterized protein LOC129402068 n=1 Tax=Sorex araneus TaxID=42254 RepID=UPI0024337BCE|nr:uncharacterized protein LOC129402068 [Sorex araneus]